MNVIEAILQERRRQNGQWGEQKHDDFYWLSILVEEVGELAQAILRGSTALAGNRIEGSSTVAATELTEVAAVAVAWLEAIQRRGVAEVRRGE